MIRISILYPYIADSEFNFDYYTQTHMPRSVQLLSAHPGFRNVTVERGIGGTELGSSPAYIAGCFYTFDFIGSFLAAFMPHATELKADIVNFTNISPQIQFNEVLIDWSEARFI